MGQAGSLAEAAVTAKQRPEALYPRHDQWLLLIEPASASLRLQCLLCFLQQSDA